MTATRTPDAESLWQAARQVVLDRDGRRCVECGEVGNLHVHHIVPRYLGGADEPANLITLCAACHAVRHPNLQVALSRPFIERWAIRLARWLDTAGELRAETDALARTIRNRRMCFRNQIVDAFEEGGPRRRSWSIRIIEHGSRRCT